MPAPILKLALRDAATELLLADQEVLSTRLQADGFVFRYPTAEEAVDAYAR